MSIWARRYHWQEVHPFENTMLLDAFVEHPEFLSYPAEPAFARAVGASLLESPANIIYTTYTDKVLTGVVILTRIVPRVDALLHFMFLDKDLVSKRKLLNNIIGVAFTDFGFNRLSMEVPEGVRLERFARKVLNFRLEGENRPRNPEMPKSLTDNWVSRQGSRREGSYFDGTAWKDIVLLRLLASEWVGEQGVECRYQQSSGPLPPSQDPLSEVP